MGLGTIPPEAIVVRTGQAEASTLAFSTWQYWLKAGEYGLSFWSWPDMTAEEIVWRVRRDAESRRARNPVPHPVMRHASADELLGVVSGSSLEQTGRPGHYTYHFPLDLADCDCSEEKIRAAGAHIWEALDMVLCKPVANPAKGQPNYG